MTSLGMLRPFTLKDMSYNLNRVELPTLILRFNPKGYFSLSGAKSRVWVEQWPLPSFKLKQFDVLVKQQLLLGHIRSSMSPWNAPVFVVCVYMISRMITLLWRASKKAHHEKRFFSQ